MATYAELFNLHNDTDLKNRVAVAVIVAADIIKNEDVGTTNHANRLIWAAGAFNNPRSDADRMFWAVLAANNTATILNIQNATDTALQDNIDDAVDLFATG